jgi:hypothetical protein
MAREAAPPPKNSFGIENPFPEIKCFTFGLWRGLGQSAMLGR